MQFCLQSIFARLGGKTTIKRAATSTVSFEEDEDDIELGSAGSLEYAGVLKASPTKKAKIEAAKKIMKTAQKTLGTILLFHRLEIITTELLFCCFLIITFTVSKQVIHFYLLYMSLTYFIYNYFYNQKLCLFSMPIMLGTIKRTFVKILTI